MIIFLNQAKANDLVGVWYTDCNILGRHSYKVSSTFTEGQTTVIMRIFERQQCAGHSMTVVYEGNYSIGRPFGEGVEINHIPSSVRITLHLQSVVNQYNDLSSSDGCGTSDWKLNVSQEVSGRYCRPFIMPTIGKMIYDIFGTLNDDVRFGGIPLMWDMDSAQKRPTQLSPVVFHLLN